MNSKVALYARVSTGRQEKEETIDSQLAEVKERIVKDGYSLDGHYIFTDDGWSGSILARPALDLLRDVAVNKEIEAIYVYDLGRLSRDFTNQLVLLREFEDIGVKVISLHDINPENEEQELMRKVLGSFHEYERTKITERFRRGKLFKARKGLIVHGCGHYGPYGYTYILVKKDDLGNKINGYYEVNENEAKNVRLIFSLVGNKGMTIRQVIKYLNEKGILPRKSKRNAWNTSTLSRMLRDESYIGTSYYAKGYAVEPDRPFKNEKYKRIKKSSRKLHPKDQWIAIPVPIIIDKVLFDKVQRQLELNGLFAMRNKKNNYLVCGLIWCACGRRRAGEGNSKKNHVYYRCEDRVLRYPFPRECHAKGVDAVVLDGTIWTHLFKLLTTPREIKHQAYLWSERINSGKTLEVNELPILLTNYHKLDEMENKYMQLFAEDMFSKDMLREKINDIRLKKKTLESSITRMKQEVELQANKLTLPDLSQLCDKMAEVLHSLSFIEKQAIVRKLITRVVTDGKVADVYGRMSLTLPENDSESENVMLKSKDRYCGAT